MTMMAPMSGALLLMKSANGDSSGLSFFAMMAPFFIYVDDSSLVNYAPPEGGGFAGCALPPWAPWCPLVLRIGWFPVSEDSTAPAFTRAMVLHGRVFG